MSYHVQDSPPAKNHPAPNVSDTETKKPCSREEKAVQSHFPWDHMDLHRVRDIRTYSVRDHTVSGITQTYSVKDRTDLQYQGPTQCQGSHRPTVSGITQT